MSRASPAVSAGVVLALRGLRELLAWDECAALTERALESLRDDGEGLDRRDRARLQSWPRRWRALNTGIRAFYVIALVSDLAEEDRAAVACGLRTILDGQHPEDWVRGRLRRLYLEITGEEAGYVLCPIRPGEE
mgnify:CR=1 FL=1